MKPCSIPDCGQNCEGTTDMCGTHNRAARKAKQAQALINRPRKKPNRVSKKMKALLPVYYEKARNWKKGKKCAVYPWLRATTVHHMKGRVGYADQWARDNDIPLLLDERYWLPASLDGHRYIEEHPGWAREKGFTLSRHEEHAF